MKESLAQRVRQVTWKPLNFSNPNFKKIKLEEKIEEELFPDYVASRYYPVCIGELLRERYQIVGKLGFGTTSTVWLAPDLRGRQHVALKLFVNSEAMGKQLDRELAIYKRISTSATNHRDCGAVRKLLDFFDVTGLDGRHYVLTFFYCNLVRRLPALIIYTDIKADNIMLSIDDDSVFIAFEEQELSDLSLRKEIGDNRVIYLLRELEILKEWGAPVLYVPLNVYRAPEVILRGAWLYLIDIWNAGCMVWDLFEGGHFRAHLAEIAGLLGKPPRQLLDRGKLSYKFFNDRGDFHPDIPLAASVPLEQRETNLEREELELFLAMMRRMLQWQPADRSTAKTMADDKWIRRHM
ncbi:serine threonine protein kinase, CMGC group [Xylaria arbuscula]|nr:serine threonine protein kinase, CMGC group [Xylaria arbuscula]